ncbi:MAG: hypothetical protein E6G10_12310 [Actinobacteria bacterium]|nr:MAG: hypothetical protein E6G10_12310 [Actinomycetota bacterium]
MPDAPVARGVAVAARRAAIRLRTRFIRSSTGSPVCVAARARAALAPELNFAAQPPIGVVAYAVQVLTMSCARR